MVELWWVWLAAAGGLAVGMFLFAVMTMSASEPEHELVAPSTPDALT